jgi:microsomal epoxide hydrolase
MNPDTRRAEIKPFTIQVPDAILDDLMARLALTRWPDEVGSNWQYGTDLAYLKSLCDYWLNQYDWRSQEANLNSLDHFTTAINGRRVHFIHQRSSNEDAMPLVMTHGWPGSITEFTKIIPMLTEPQAFGGKAEDAFHLVCPSIPGYGFSEPPAEPGFDQQRVAEGHLELMDRLGYTRFGAQGGDWGSPISSWTAALAPDKVCGLHLTLVFAGYPKHKADPFEGVSDEERTVLEQRRAAIADGTGYQAIQGTRPQTLGYGLNDSPAGLAAWITEKFHAWMECNGDIESAITRDELLTNIMVYWVNGCITSSMRLYYESAHADNNLFERGRIATPTGCAMFPGELYQPPRAWAEALYNIQHWTRMPAGGHFAALEQPTLLAQDLRVFFRQLRQAT